MPISTGLTSTGLTSTGLTLIDNVNTRVKHHTTRVIARLKTTGNVTRVRSCMNKWFVLGISKLKAFH